MCRDLITSMDIFHNVTTTLNTFDSMRLCTRHKVSSCCRICVDIHPDSGPLWVYRFEGLPQPSAASHDDVSSLLNVLKS